MLHFSVWRSFHCFSITQNGLNLGIIELKWVSLSHRDAWQTVSVVDLIKGLAPSVPPFLLWQNISKCIDWAPKMTEIGNFHIPPPYFRHLTINSDNSAWKFLNRPSTSKINYQEFKLLVNKGYFSRKQNITILIFAVWVEALINTPMHIHSNLKCMTCLASNWNDVKKRCSQ
jgi:hypothetical protein